MSALSLGFAHTCAVADGGAWCWGWNGYGQLGDGQACGMWCSTPVDVSGLTSGVAAVSGGQSHTCALTVTGAVKCWGPNDQGELGNGTTMPSSVPVDVTGLSSGVESVSSGGYFGCALTTDGAVRCWGDNYVGELGDGTTTDSSVPVDVSGLSSGVVAVSASAGHTCALTVAGGVKCWGWNGYGQLGDGTTVDSSVPVDVTGLTGGVVAVSAGWNHTCALTAAGGVTCWGANYDGQLGNGTTVDSSVPVDVSGLAGGVAAISAGTAHTCAVLIVSGVKCWGVNFDGELGNGTTMSSTMPVSVSGLSSAVAAVSAGGLHTCARMADGVKCWGHNFDGQLGDGTTVDSSTPVNVHGKIGGDTDGDGCADTRELQFAPGSEATGGRRNFKNPWDFYDTDGSKVIDLFIDMFGVAYAFGLTSADPGYSTALDRSAAAPQGFVWDLGPPDGTIDLFTDIFGVAFQFGHDCT